MQGASDDPKAGERAYYARLGPDGLRHARGKPYSDRDCGKYLVDMGALLQMIGPPPGAVLDLGCGTGWTSRILARAGFEVLGVDISPDAIGIARSVALEENATGVQFVEADYEGFKSERSFDYALFYDSLHAGDYPVVIGIALLSAALVVLLNIVADVLYGVLDHRIQYA